MTEVYRQNIFIFFKVSYRIVLQVCSKEDCIVRGVFFVIFQSHYFHFVLGPQFLFLWKEGMVIIAKKACRYHTLLYRMPFYWH